MKKIFCTLLAVILLLVSSVALAASIPQPALDARGSTVYIEVDISDDYYSSGSGFAIGAGAPVEYVVTNHHVVAEMAGACTVFFGDYTPVTATVVVSLPDKDLSVLKLDDPIPAMNPLPLYSGNPSDLAGEQVYALGFPAVADNLFERGGSVRDDMTMTDGIISAVKSSYSFGTGERAVTGLQMNVALNHGNSGGPLVNGEGIVVGVNTIGSAEDTNLNGAICISELLPVLDREGIPYRASSNILYSSVLWVIVAAGAAAIVFLLWFLIWRKKFKRNKTILLADYLDKNSAKLDYDRAMALLAPIVMQLDALHRENKSHLAVYPQNIRVQLSTGRAFLSSSREHGVLNGYSAPEQYREVEPVGSWTDIYQLGAILYRLLCGERLPDMMARLESDETTKREIESLQILSGTKQALKLAVAMKPDIRIGNAAQFMTAFHIAPGAVPLPAHMSAKKERRGPSPKKKKRIITLCIVGGIVAAVCTGAGMFVSTNNQAYKYLADGDYTRAYQTISKLPNISGGISDLKRISEAGMLMESGNYDEARTLLTGIESLDESRLILGELNFRQGIDLIINGQFEEGEAYIDTSYEFPSESDSDYIDYARANAYALAEDYTTAEKIFSSLGNYRDSYELASKCAICIAADYLDKDFYMMALDILMKYSDLPEIQDILDELVDQNNSYYNYLKNNYF
ncbi:trypsin-like peptidase domain-containing protein [Christensenella intestinihominis]|uniref:trypsin-like peptidase domain-containing protein n=1 Tax=Christensenella intestinihominis TaxID=1851429 RepID=UPI000835C43F|nr:trypsin-like peptidase domain-containing protein [Christensenella intestinihominis]